MSTIDKAFDIVEAVLQHEEGLGLKELSDITGLPAATIHRICTYLVKRGYIYQAKKRGNYLLGVKFAQFRSYSTATSLKEQAAPFLKKLCDDTSETTLLTVYYGVSVVIIDIILPKQVVMAIPDVKGGKFPLHCTASGKILLAYLNEDRLKNVIRNPGLTAYTENTIVDTHRLHKEIQAIRSDGIAFDDEEYLPGVVSTAAPLINKENDLIASIGVVAPTLRINSTKLRQLAPMVKKTALELSHSINGTEKSF